MAKALSSLVGSPQDRPPTSIGGRNITTAPTALVTPTSAAGLAVVGQPIYSGALTADTYKSILSLSAPGVLKMCNAWQTDANARQVGLRIDIDGVTVFDVYRTSSTASGSGINAVGVIRSSGETFDRVPFNTLEVFVKSSLSETDKIGAFVIYDLV